MSLKGDYSVLVYNEEKRYYLMQAQRNKPFLDSEIRHMDKARFDMTRRVAQSLLGDIASPLNTYSSKLSNTNEAFKVVAANDPSLSVPGSTVNNFAVKGGDGTLDSAGILYYKGIYTFFKGNIFYKDQQRTSTLKTEDWYTTTPIADISTPIGSDRIDVVYLDISFDEAAATADATYPDADLRNPNIGSNTANRLRAVFDIKVYEGWTDPTDVNIFNNPFFGFQEINQIQHYRVPLAIVRRLANNSNILSGMIEDLLTKHEKRVFSLKELAHRLRHGGSVSGEELWNTIGQNEGIDSEALNDDSVTPRIIDNLQNYKMRTLTLGSTGNSGVTINNPEDLLQGDLDAGRAYLSRASIGYTGLDTGWIDPESARTNNHKLRVDTVGLIAGEAGVSVRSRGVAGVDSFAAGDYSNPHFVVDHRGFIATQKSTPEFPLDVGGTARIVGNLFAESNAYFDKELAVGEGLYAYGGIFGDDFIIPDGIISDYSPIIIGKAVEYYNTNGSMRILSGYSAIGTNGFDPGSRGYGFYEGYDAFDRRGFYLGFGNSESDLKKVSLNLDDADFFESYGDWTFKSHIWIEGQLAVEDTITFYGLLDMRGSVEGYDYLLPNGDLEGSSPAVFGMRALWSAPTDGTVRAWGGYSAIGDAFGFFDGFNVDGERGYFIGGKTDGDPRTVYIDLDASDLFETSGNWLFKNDVKIEGLLTINALSVDIETLILTKLAIGTTEICTTQYNQNNVRFDVWDDAQFHGVVSIGTTCEWTHDLYTVLQLGGDITSGNIKVSTHYNPSRYGAVWFQNLETFETAAILGYDSVSAQEIGFHLYDVGTFIVDRSAGSDANFEVRGNATVKELTRLGDTDDSSPQSSNLSLLVGKDAQVDGTLYVNNLQIIGSVPPPSNPLIGNLKVLNDIEGEEGFTGPYEVPGNLFEKTFSMTQSVLIAQSREELIQRWNNATSSYLNGSFSAGLIGEGGLNNNVGAATVPTEVINFMSPKNLVKDEFRRVIVHTLGQLNVSWTGVYANHNPADGITPYAPVYYYPIIGGPGPGPTPPTPFLFGSDDRVTIVENSLELIKSFSVVSVLGSYDWKPPYFEGNRLVNLNASIIERPRDGTNSAAAVIYSIDQPMHFYIDPSWLTVRQVKHPTKDSFTYQISLEYVNIVYKGALYDLGCVQSTFGRGKAVPATWSQFNKNYKPGHNGDFNYPGSFDGSPPETDCAVPDSSTRMGNTNNTLGTNGGEFHFNAPDGFEAAIFPKYKPETFRTSSFNSEQNQVYSASWDLELIIFPNGASPYINNLIGKISLSGPST
jgi:hypothetical protein